MPPGSRRARAFAEFLIAAQEPDGAWRRAYTFAGEPMTEAGEAGSARPRCSRNRRRQPVIPFLVALHGLTGDARLLVAAERAGAFVAVATSSTASASTARFDDSIYARPQLVDGESIMFRDARASPSPSSDRTRLDYLAGARRAAQLVVTWILPLGRALAGGFHPRPLRLPLEHRLDGMRRAGRRLHPPDGHSRGA